MSTYRHPEDLLADLRDREAPPSEAVFCYEWNNQNRRVEERDLIEELGDTDGALIAAVKSGNIDLIGRMVRDVYTNYIDRLTYRELDMQAKRLSANEVAQAILDDSLSALLRASIEQAKETA